MHTGKPITYAAPVGFLMNEYRDTSLKERLAAAETTVIHPLVMRARNGRGNVTQHYAINEVSLFRQTYQVARLQIMVDGQERLADRSATALVATPAGSTAYDLSAPGRIIPIDAPLLALAEWLTRRPRR